MKSARDETTAFMPQWNADGLMPAIAQDVNDGEVKMMAWMNETALKRTLDTKYVHYFSRSRKKIWKKGESSGNVQKLVDLRIDCDQDCLLLLVEQEGAACHTNRSSCFYRRIKSDNIVEFLD